MTFDQLGTAFRLLRKSQKRTLKEVSQGTGLSVSFICDIEKGRTLPSLKTVIALAEFYGMRVDVRLKPL